MLGSSFLHATLLFLLGREPSLEMEVFLSWGASPFHHALARRFFLSCPDDTGRLNAAKEPSRSYQSPFFETGRSFLSYEGGTRLPEICSKALLVRAALGDRGVSPPDRVHYEGCVIRKAPPFLVGLPSLRVSCPKVGIAELLLDDSVVNASVASLA